jgi:hypothetical protein
MAPLTGVITLSFHFRFSRRHARGFRVARNRLPLWERGTFFISAMAAFFASLTCTPLKPKKLTRHQVRLAQAA